MDQYNLFLCGENKYSSLLLVQYSYKEVWKYLIETAQTVLNQIHLLLYLLLK